MQTTTIKVSTDLRDTLAAVARRDKLTLAGVIERDHAAVEEARFWAEMDKVVDHGAFQQELDELGPIRRDGLEPREDWSDLL